MSRTQYEIYKEKVFALAKTMIVKHEEIAIALNHELSFAGYYDALDNNPYNWRYYLNLSGEYHQYDHDRLFELTGNSFIQIQVATDNGYVQVPFTKTLLLQDISLANEYQIGSNAYKNLVRNYPDFETLIIGILNPIDIDVAIKAKNAEILYIDNKFKQFDGDRGYFKTAPNRNPNNLIEYQEHNLIDELQRHLYIYNRNWVNAEYIHGNDLYVVTTLATWYATIPNTIMNIRLGNCKTPYAHTFHIKQYLNSFGQLGKYVDFIPIGTALWLYRNAMYLEANRGKQLTFNGILDNAFTPNQVPMNAYSARHEISQMDSDNLLPIPVLYKEPINFEIPGISDDDRTVKDILQDEISLARENYRDIDDKVNHIESKIKWGGDDRINTKVLETEMMELGEPFPFTLSQILFSMWGYTAVKGYYTGTIYVTHPITNDKIGLTPLNAYILAAYCLNYGVAGKKLKNIPTSQFFHIPRTTVPRDKPTDTRFALKPSVDDAMGWVNNDKTRRLKVVELFGSYQPNFTATSPTELFNNANDVYHERIRKYYTYCNTEDITERGDLELVAKRLYWSGFSEPLGTGSYEAWFRKVGIDTEHLTPEDYLALGLNTVAMATGSADSLVERKKWLQKSLVAILKHFISYTVHIIEKFADGVVTYLEGQSLRFSNFKWTYTNIRPIGYVINVDIDYGVINRNKLVINLPDIITNMKVMPGTSLPVNLDLSSFDIRLGRDIKKPITYALGTTLFNFDIPPVYTITADYPERFRGSSYMAVSNIKDITMLSYRIDVVVNEGYGANVSVRNVTSEDSVVKTYAADKYSTRVTTLSVRKNDFALNDGFNDITNIYALPEDIKHLDYLHVVKSGMDEKIHTRVDIADITLHSFYHENTFNEVISTDVAVTDISLLTNDISGGTITEIIITTPKPLDVSQSTMYHESTYVDSYGITATANDIVRIVSDIGAVNSDNYEVGAVAKEIRLATTEASRDIDDIYATTAISSDVSVKEYLYTQTTEDGFSTQVIADDIRVKEYSHSLNDSDAFVMQVTAKDVRHVETAPVGYGISSYAIEIKPMDITAKEYEYNPTAADAYATQVTAKDVRHYNNVVGGFATGSYTVNVNVLDVTHHEMADVTVAHSEYLTQVTVDTVKQFDTKSDLVSSDHYTAQVQVDTITKLDMSLTAPTKEEYITQAKVLPTKHYDIDPTTVAKSGYLVGADALNVKHYERNPTTSTESGYSTEVTGADVKRYESNTSTAGTSSYSINAVAMNVKHWDFYNATTVSDNYSVTAIANNVNRDDLLINTSKTDIYETTGIMSDIVCIDTELATSITNEYVTGAIALDIKHENVITNSNVVDEYISGAIALDIKHENVITNSNVVDGYDSTAVPLNLNLE